MISSSVGAKCVEVWAHTLRSYGALVLDKSIHPINISPLQGEGINSLLHFQVEATKA